MLFRALAGGRDRPGARGAIYSNFSTMEELAAAMLDDHLARSWAHNRTLAAHHPDPVGLVIPPDRLGVILVALEDGLRLHRLIDPDSTPADAFYDALDALQQLAAPPAGT